MPVVLLSPLGLDADCWQFAALPAAVRHEFPGIGTRRTYLPEVSLASLADELAGQYAGPLDLIGVSLGGAVGLNAALRHPGRVRSLMIACCSSVANTQALQERANEVENLGMNEARVVTPLLERWFTSAALATPEHPSVTYTRRQLLADDPHMLAAYWRAVSHNNVQDRLGGLSAATTCVVATHDAAATPERMERIYRALPRARLTVVDGPHMVHMERAAEFATAVRQHLSWVQT